MTELEDVLVAKSSLDPGETREALRKKIGKQASAAPPVSAARLAKRAIASWDDVVTTLLRAAGEVTA